jgi:predicted nucleic acid-binding protein
MSTPISCVLDCSIALSWYFADESDPYANSVQDSLTQAVATVPAIWPLEVTNALLMGERRGRSTATQATAWLAMLRSLPILVDEETVPRAWNDTLQLARAHGLTSYDASYLELALRLGAPLATLDAKLRTAAAAVGVALFKGTAP